MAKETVVEIHEALEELLKLGARKLKLVLIHHDEVADPYNTSLVLRGTLPSGKTTDALACPNPCQIGKSFNSQSK